MNNVHFGRLFASILYKKKYPFALSWAITQQCNQHCLYCAGGGSGEDDLPFENICTIVDQAYASGTRWISYTGGEPLLRKDIREIISYTKKTGIKVKINTNGYLLAERIGDVAEVDFIHLSLDGTHQTNDAIRGKGTFAHAIEGIRVAQQEGIPCAINTVISKGNIYTLQDILSLAKQHAIPVSFQPAAPFRWGSTEPNPVAPDPEELQKAIEWLLQVKRNPSSRGLILNSRKGLRYLASWPRTPISSCFAGIVSFRINYKGYLFNCDEYREKGIDILQHGFVHSIALLPKNSCRECWASSQIEFNLLLSLKPEAVIHYLRFLLRKARKPVSK